MSDSGFFSGLSSGMRMPESVWNQGPLPSQATSASGGPAGLFGVETKINYGSTLLGEIGPYDYGRSDHVGNDTSYMNIPNRIAKLVPIVSLPGSNIHEEWITVTHPIDDGDVAFVLRDMAGRTMLDRVNCERFYTERNCNSFLNLATVNYLLAGIQLYIRQEGHMYGFGIGSRKVPQSWKVLLQCLGFEKTSNVTEDDIIELISNTLLPFGVMHGSEEQGGNHEGVESVVTWATNFVTTLYTEGYIRNLVNLWRGESCSSGDYLTFQLERVPVNELTDFALTHYYKAPVRKRFPVVPGDTQKFLQLVPRVFNMRERMTNSSQNRALPYWRIAMPYVKWNKYSDDHPSALARNDDTSLKGALLEAAFQPVWCRSTVTARPAYKQHFQGQTGGGAGGQSATSDIPALGMKRYRHEVSGAVNSVAESEVARRVRAREALAGSSVTSAAPRGSEGASERKSESRSESRSENKTEKSESKTESRTESKTESRAEKPVAKAAQKPRKKTKDDDEFTEAF